VKKNAVQKGKLEPLRAPRPESKSPGMAPGFFRQQFAIPGRTLSAGNMPPIHAANQPTDGRRQPGSPPTAAAATAAAAALGGPRPRPGRSFGVVGTRLGWLRRFRVNSALCCSFVEEIRTEDSPARGLPSAVDDGAGRLIETLPVTLVVEAQAPFSRRCTSRPAGPFLEADLVLPWSGSLPGLKVAGSMPVGQVCGLVVDGPFSSEAMGGAQRPADLKLAVGDSWSDRALSSFRLVGFSLTERQKLPAPRPKPPEVDATAGRGRGRRPAPGSRDGQAGFR